jgi:hypothetical protein
MLTFALEMLRSPFVPTRKARRVSREEATQRVPGADLIFRMRAWPQLPEHGRTAEVYRMLSVMSNQPVNRQWLMTRCTMAPQELDSLLQQLVKEGSVEVIDPATYARGQALQG